jgi:hypothetical protein
MPAVDTVLKTEFNARHVDAAIRHFRSSIEAFEKEDWEETIAKGGKFVEAVSKALWLRAGKTLPPARQFKVGAVIAGLRNLPHGTLDDNIRVTVPRACEFVYDLASNRGARHDPDEVDPNEMDATTTVSNLSWILAELVRYAGKGSFSFLEVSDLISGLVEKRFPLIETVDGRTYFHVKNRSAREVGLLLLARAHPGRISPADLVIAIMRHSFSRENAQLAVRRLHDVVDIDAIGELRLLRPGLIEAEQIMRDDRNRP